MQKITPCLWFDTQAEEAANFYVSLFEDAAVTNVQRLDGTPSGDNVALVFFLLAGHDYMAINGGPQFPFTEAVSFSVSCGDQDEVDRLWTALTAGGGEEGQCGWLKDRFGLSWQVIPERMGELLSDPDPERSQRAMQAMLQMGKIDVQVLEDAANGAFPPTPRPVDGA